MLGEKKEKKEKRRMKLMKESRVSLIEILMESIKIQLYSTTPCIQMDFINRGIKKKLDLKLKNTCNKLF